MADLIEQIRWERDVAIQQLKELGYGLGEKIRTDGDTISRQAALALAHEIAVPTKSGIIYRHRCIDPCDIRELPSVSQWIPCSEQLPDKTGRYLVTHRKFGKLEATWNIFYGGDHASWLWNDEIIAWMPLPEPYGERRTDDEG